MTLIHGFDTVRDLWKHQLDALKIAGGKKDFALFFEPGCGKTLTAITLARFKMFMQRRALKTLVLCPPIVIKNWKSEWLEASKFKHDEVLCLLGTGANRAKLMKDTKAKVVIMNYESLLMEPLMKEIYRWGPEVLIFDESHRCKALKSKRTKEAVKLSKHPTVMNRYILTGTPILNSPMDIFSQFLILDKGETFGQNFFTFRGKYFVDKNARMPSHIHFPQWVIREGALGEITKKIEAKSVFVAKKDCLDLPPLIKKTISVSLAPEQKRAYNAMLKDFLTVVDGKLAVAQLALTKALRLMQIVSGFVSVEDDDETIHEFKDNPRRDALRDLLSDLEGQKVIVWASFRHNYGVIRDVCESIGLNYVEIHGDIPNAQKYKNVDTFNNDPDCAVCIGHPGSGGIGINLVAAACSVFYSRSFSLEHDLQAEARNHRGGSERHETVVRYDLCAEETIDEAIMKRLAEKQAISDKVILDLALELR